MSINDVIDSLGTSGPANHWTGDLSSDSLYFVDRIAGNNMYTGNCYKTNSIIGDGIYNPATGLPAYTNNGTLAIDGKQKLSIIGTLSFNESLISTSFSNVFGKYADNNNYFYFNIWQTGGVLYFIVGLRSAGVGTNFEFMRSSVTSFDEFVNKYNNKKYYPFTISIDLTQSVFSNKWDVYFCGVSIKEVKYWSPNALPSSVPNLSTYPLGVLGLNYFGASLIPLNGLLDEFAIYPDYVLTHEDHLKYKNAIYENIGTLNCKKITQNGLIGKMQKAYYTESFKNNGRSFITVRDTLSIAPTVTIDSKTNCNETNTHDESININAGDTVSIGPFEKDKYNDSRDLLSLNIDNISGVEIEAYTL